MIKFPNSDINCAARRGIARAGEMVEMRREGGPPSYEIAHVHTFKRDKNGKDVSVTIGFECSSGNVHAHIVQHTALAQKLNVLLWQCAFEDGAFATGDEQAQRRGWINLPVSELCDALGYARQRDGTHQPRDKRLVFSVIRTLMRMHIHAIFQQYGRTYDLSGPLWSEGASLRELTEDGPLPLHIQYLPGPWFSYIYQRENPWIGIIHCRVLELESAADRWTIALGLHLAEQARLSRYHDQVGNSSLRRERIEEEIGLAGVYGKRKSQAKAHLAKAFDRLVETGAIERWNWMYDDSDEKIEIYWTAESKNEFQRSGLMAHPLPAPIDDDGLRQKLSRIDRNRRLRA